MQSSRARGAEEAPAVLLESQQVPEVDACNLFHSTRCSARLRCDCCDADRADLWNCEFDAAKSSTAPIMRITRRIPRHSPFIFSRELIDILNSYGEGPIDYLEVGCVRAVS